MEVEYGSNGNLRFWTNENPEMSVGMFDGKGNRVFCKCGNPATSGAIGREAYISWCAECSRMNQYTAEFVYREKQ